MKLKNMFIVLLPLMVIFLSLGSISCQGQIGSNAGGDKAPGFTLKDLDGKDYSLEDTAGKVVIIDFWATWCPPCQAEIPHFQALYEQYQKDGLEIIGIALDRGGVRDVKPFIEEKGVTYPIVIGNQQVVNSYGGIRGIPTTFILDRKGNIVEKHVGYRGKEVFEGAIKKLL